MENEKNKKKLLSVEDVSNMLQVTREYARKKMKEMSGCVNLGSQRYQILMVPYSGFEAWLRNHQVFQG